MMATQTDKKFEPILHLLKLHGRLKFSTMRSLLRESDRLELVKTIREMQQKELIEYAIDEHYKFSGYALTPNGMELAQ